MSTWQLLKNKFPEPECVLIEEVSDASGHARSRSLDFMAINLWNSRGLAITGIELKSWRGDWLKELKNPAKQENHYKYCDYFYLLTDKEDVAKLTEIPETWGWLHIDIKGRLKTMKVAPKLNSIPVNRSFLCAMLRRAAAKENHIHKDQINSEVEKRAEELSKQRVIKFDSAPSELASLQKTVHEFEEASGIKISDPWEYSGNSEQLGKVLKVILKRQSWDSYTAFIKKQSNDAKQFLDKTKKQLEELEVITKEIHVK